MINNEVVDDKVAIINAFNGFYVNIGPHPASVIPSIDIQPQQYLEVAYSGSFFAKPVCEEEV